MIGLSSTTAAGLATIVAASVPGVVAASGGNHGAAVAYAATSLGHASRIYVPRAIAKEEKLRRMRHFGGEVILTEGSVADCMTEYARAAEETGAACSVPSGALRRNSCPWEEPTCSSRNPA